MKIAAKKAPAMELSPKGPGQWGLRISQTDPGTGVEVIREVELHAPTERGARERATQLTKALAAQASEYATRVLKDEQRRRAMMEVAGWFGTPALATTAPPTAAAATTDTPRSTLATHRVTLGDFASSWFGTKLARGDLAPSTAYRYAVTLDHLPAALLDAPIAELTAAQIEHWMIAALALEAAGASTINSWRQVLEGLCAQAVADGILARNPVLSVKRLKERPNLARRVPATPKNTLTLLHALDEIAATIAALCYVQAATGARLGEVSVMQWSDLDPIAGTVTIQRTISRGHIRPTSKNLMGRQPGLPPPVLARLEAHRARLGAQGVPTGPGDLMFPSTVGRPIYSSVVSKAIRNARERAGITDNITTHSFRRMVTDLLRRSKTDEVVAKAIIGHQTSKMRAYYSTVSPDEAREAAARVWDMIEAPAAENAVPAGNDSEIPNSSN